MDMFSDLENFLSGGAGVPLPDSPNITFDDSLDAPSENDTKTSTTTNNKTGKAHFLPAKGQKLAAKRLQKLQAEVSSVIKSKISPKLSQKTKKIGLPSDSSAARQIAAILAQQKVAGSSDTGASKSPNKRRRGKRYPVQEDVIDLVNSPQLLIPGIVTLDSDEELQEIRQKTAVCVDAPQIENNEINIKILCNSNLIELSFRRHQKFLELRKLIADKMSTEPNSILLLFKDRVVDLDETPHKIGYVPGMVFFASLMDCAPVAAKKRRKVDDVVLKIQSAFWKKSREVCIGKKEPLQVLICMCAEELECDVNSIKLLFDGDVLDANQTAEDYDLEGGEVIDIHKK